jgi:hypothetical protein
MHPRSRPIRLRIPLPAVEYRVFVSAQRKLRRIMGTKAPDVNALIQSQLHGRDVTGLTDEYLDFVGWPPAAGRMISLRRSARPFLKAGRAVPRPRSRPLEPELPGHLPADPSRN